MHWLDDAIVLSVRKHGETAAIASLLTREHGRHSGLVRGGAGRRLKGVLQPGNQVIAGWRGRLAEHLGVLTIEPGPPWAARLLEAPAKLAALSAACALVEATLPERQPHAPLHDGLLVLLQGLDEQPDWPALYIRWELGLLAELGFGLDLAACAVSGRAADLAYVSPKTGRAVSAAAGAPYAQRLLRLPSFLAGGHGVPPANDFRRDVADGLALTGFFLRHSVFEPHQLSIPAARERLVERLTRDFAPSTVSSGPASGVKPAP